MMAFDYRDAFIQCTVDLNVVVMRKLYAHVFPHLPAPQSDAAALAVLHHARTQMPAVPFRLRAYSHYWLLDHDLPSGLSDDLKPRAEREYPQVQDAVGISVNSKWPDLKAAVHGAMSNAVLEAYDDGRTEPAFVRQRMMEARDKVRG